MAAAKSLPIVKPAKFMKKTLMATSLSVWFALAAYPADSTVMITNVNRSVWRSDGHRFGAGIILGEPTGAALKYWLSDRLAIDGAIGASYNDDGDQDASFYLHSDVLWHEFDLLPVSKGRLPVYIGAGVLVRFRDNEDNQVGVRIPVGLSYMFDNAPVDIFAEIAPAIDVTPSVRGEVTGGIGIRLWF
jgi:hypothetical protein